jgi:hypothetical protein
LFVHAAEVLETARVVLQLADRELLAALLLTQG